MVGKWHLGYQSPVYTPTRRGFDFFYGYYGAGINYWTKTSVDDLINGIVDLSENGGPVLDAAELSADTWSPFLYTAKAAEAIEEHAATFANAPMFLYFSSQLIHDPASAPESYLAKCR